KLAANIWHGDQLFSKKDIARIFGENEKTIQRDVVRPTDSHKEPQKMAVVPTDQELAEGAVWLRAMATSGAESLRACLETMEAVSRYADRLSERYPETHVLSEAVETFLASLDR